MPFAFAVFLCRSKPLDLGQTRVEIPASLLPKNGSKDVCSIRRSNLANLPIIGIYLEGVRGIRLIGRFQSFLGENSAAVYYVCLLLMPIFVCGGMSGVFRSVKIPDGNLFLAS